MTSLAVYLFLYAFPHAKSEDILLGCVRRGLPIAGIFAAPKLTLKKQSKWDGVRSLPRLDPVDPKNLANSLDIPYHIVGHDNINEIDKIVKGIGKRAIGIVGGARIIRPEVIEIFSDGIVNYHPGKIPETSGLDSFYWMLKKNVQPGVTAHFIDKRVDAGRLIKFKSIQLAEQDTPEVVKYKLHIAELQLNDDVVCTLATGSAPRSSVVDRPMKNEPMTDLEKQDAFGGFANWLMIQLAKQKATTLESGGEW